MGHHPTNIPLRERIAEALQSATANHRSAAKEIARAAGKTPQMAERWLRGENAPNAEAFLALAAKFDEVWEVMKAEAGRANDVAEAEAILDEFNRRLQERRR